MWVALGVQDGSFAAPVSRVAASVLAQSRVASSCRDLVMFAVTVFVGFFFSSLDVRGLEETEKNQVRIAFAVVVIN